LTEITIYQPPIHHSLICLPFSLSFSFLFSIHIRTAFLFCFLYPHLEKKLPGHALVVAQHASSLAVVLVVVIIISPTVHRIFCLPFFFTTVCKKRKIVVLTLNSDSRIVSSSARGCLYVVYCTIMLYSSMHLIRIYDQIRYTYTLVTSATKSDRCRSVDSSIRGHI